MELPTHVLVGSGIAVVVSTTLVVRLIAGLSKSEKSTATEKARDGQERAEQREEHWYALDEPMIIERNREWRHH